MSEEKIFETIGKVKASSDLMSFEGCPNRCRSGYYIDPYKHKRVRCEHCAELRKKLVKEQVQLDTGETVAKTLRLPNTMMGYGNFDVNTIFPQSELYKLEDWSVKFVSDVLQSLMERVSVGEPVESSLLVNFGRKAHTQLFFAPFLIRSYISGLTTAPFLRSVDVMRLRLMQSGDVPAGWVSAYSDMQFDGIVNADTCLVYVDAGAGSDKERELMAVKGLMQLRAWQGRGTLIFTDYYNRAKFDDMIADFGVMAELRDVASNTVKQSADAVHGLIDGSASTTRDLALYVSVHYKKNVKVESSQVPAVQPNMTAKDAKALFSQTQSYGVR